MHLRFPPAGCLILAAFALMTPALTPPALAFDAGAMTDAERADFRAEVRAYLLQNPEVLVEAIEVLDARKASAQALSDSDMVTENQSAIFADGRSWVGGNPQGDVTLVEFVDYRCGYCKRAHAEVTELVQTDGNIRFILKEFPILGPESVLASRFAIAVRAVAGPDIYWQLHDALMTFRGDITQAALDRLAQDLGLDPAQIATAMADPGVMAEIAANHALAEVLQISGTPTFVMQDANGRQPEILLRGYLPMADMQSMVAELRTQ